MEKSIMNKGFSFIEVMVALCIIMVFSLALFQMYALCMRSSSQSESQTRAALLCNAQMLWLESLDPAHPDLAPAWHQDPGNPLKQGAGEYFRFWDVRDGEHGKEVSLYVAWTDSHRSQAGMFSSYEDLLSSGCPAVAFACMIPGE
ncbi:MAG: prepilin-type N-terminal cleavage/methylation domain-containing protein [Desulfomonilia bacterium]|nr:prepilin-type N-terminal cleavage/methylation domain-containing protein [Desulfomonilia bacterium]